MYLGGRTHVCMGETPPTLKEVEVEVEKRRRGRGGEGGRKGSGEREGWAEEEKKTHLQVKT